MASEKPWADWPDSEVESDLEAGWFVKDNGIFEGQVDGLFHPNTPITAFQFCNVLERAEIEVDRGYFQTVDVFMKDTQKFMPNTAWSSNPEDKATRFRTAVMIYRYKNEIPAPVEPDNPSTQDEIVAERIERMFQDKPVTWNGVKRYSRMVGYGDVIVNLAREYNVPIWLALGQCWRESQWFTTGLSINYNCGWGIKDANGTWGCLGNPATVSGYSNYTSIGEAIHAYFRLMDGAIYRDYINNYLVTGDMNYIYKALDIYAPGYENNTYQHHKIVTIVKEWCEERGIE